MTLGVRVAMKMREGGCDPGVRVTMIMREGDCDPGGESDNKNERM